jgi:peptidoglycan biosynthesis protein MviN/MurJ (putative lipid II flippase)
MLALAIPAAAVLAAGLRPLLAAAFGFDDAGTNLLTLTSRIYLFTLAGYVVQETLARTFYARKEPMLPLYGVLARLVVYVLVGISGLALFPMAGAPLIAAAELSLSMEAFLLLFWLNRRIEPKVNVIMAIGKGLLAAVVSGCVSYALAVFLPGPGYLTALIGMAVGGLLALTLVWSEARLIFRL